MPRHWSNKDANKGGAGPCFKGRRHRVMEDTPVSTTGASGRVLSDVARMRLAFSQRRTSRAPGWDDYE
jgi:hypothetical protein